MHVRVKVKELSHVLHSVRPRPKVATIGFQIYVCRQIDVVKTRSLWVYSVQEDSHSGDKIFDAKTPCKDNVDKFRKVWRIKEKTM